MQQQSELRSLQPNILSKYASVFVVLPLLSNAFPYLITMAQAATEQDERRALIILFLILKRVYLYCMAISIIDLAALRSVDLPSSLGSRLKLLNDEILQSVGTANISKTFNDGEVIIECNSHLKLAQVAKQAYAKLDNVSGVSIAFFLPAFLAFSLFSSFFLFGSTLSNMDTSSSLLSSEVLQSLKRSLNVLPVLVCHLAWYSVVSYSSLAVWSL